jgi:hypothetical protein
VTVVAVLPVGPDRRDTAASPPLPLRGDGEVTVPIEPLLDPSLTSVILEALLARHVPEGPVDPRALVRTVADCRPIVRLPRRKIRTTRFGALVLVDQGDDMFLFQQDQEHLVDDIRNLLGADNTLVGYFHDVPNRVGLAQPGVPGRTKWRPLTPPRSGTPIVVISDLGISSGRELHALEERANWGDFARLAAASGCTHVVFVPASFDRIPDWARTLLHMVSWDLSLTLYDVYRLPG